MVEVDNNDRTKEISDRYDIEGWTGFQFPGRKGKVSISYNLEYHLHYGKQYSKMQWCFNDFTGVDYDDKAKKTGIFRIHVRSPGGTLLVTYLIRVTANIGPITWMARMLIMII